MLILISLIIFSASVAILIFTKKLENSINAAPVLTFYEIADYPKISVIIPAYNEEINIQDCVQAVIASKFPKNYPHQIEIFVVDDQSTDQTLAIAEKLAESKSPETTPLIKVISGLDRPTDQVWRGKNWACAQGAKLATGEYLLFIDADVRLEPDAIAAAVSAAVTTKSDLLSCAPQIVCGCLAEWLVQPLIMSAIAIGFDYEAVNNPDDKTAFAAGMFMLFRRDAYAKIGGHTAVADQPVEDVELARLVKSQGLKLRFVLAISLVKVRMYQSLATLWEGWTKNYYMGSQRNLGGTLFSALVFLLIFLVPWLGAVFGVWTLIFAQIFTQNKTGGELVILLLIFLLSMVAIALQFKLRLSNAERFQQPLRYWWLGWLGGILVAGIAITSIIKTETGWGWTWRGRSLAIKKF